MLRFYLKIWNFPILRCFLVNFDAITICETLSLLVPHLFRLRLFGINFINSIKLPITIWVTLVCSLLKNFISTHCWHANYLDPFLPHSNHLNVFFAHSLPQSLHLFAKIGYGGTKHGKFAHSLTLKITNIIESIRPTGIVFAANHLIDILLLVVWIFQINIQIPDHLKSFFIWIFF